MRSLGFVVAMMLGLGGLPAHAGGAEDEALALINAARAKAGCPALAVDDRLQAAAKGHARAMAEKNFLGHTGKNGSKFGTRIKAAGYSFTKAAENFSAGQPTASGAVAEWMASTSHRKHILTCAYGQTGLAMVYQKDDKPLPGNSLAFRYYWVQVFAKP